MNESVFHAEIFYCGHVQGVGFRYEVLQIACQFEVAGYARNMQDGSVLVEIEGAENDVLAFKKEIEEQMRVFIRRVEFRSDKRPPQFAGFTIKS